MASTGSHSPSEAANQSWSDLCFIRIPATRKIWGFLGHMASQGCSRCKKNFMSGEGLDFSGFDRENWNPRKSSEHKNAAKRSLEETGPVAQQRLCSEFGARYSVLQELKYYFVVDPMHNLYLGKAIQMMKNCGWMRKMGSSVMSTFKESKS